MLVEVVKAWKNKMTRSNNLVSAVCSTSDEVFGLVVGDTNLEKWIKKLQKMEHTKSKKSIAAIQEDIEENEVAINRDQDDRDCGDDASVDQVEERPIDKIDKARYYNLIKIHQLAKKNQEKYLSWDKAFKEHISISLATPPSKASSTTTKRSYETQNDEDSQGAKEDPDFELEDW
jgi:hypothetical protein